MARLRCPSGGVAAQVSKVMTALGKLALGTVQFGMPYGITNTSGQPVLGEVSDILTRAAQVGLSLLDTAHAYGEAESVLGDLLPSDNPLRIVTKTRPIGRPQIGAAEVEAVADGFALSLSRLCRPNVYGLMVHYAEDLLAPGGEQLWAVMDEARQAGKVERIGVSVYTPEQARQLLERFPLGLVQLPYNIYDTRFDEGGLLDELAAAGVEVHVRSVFLQGLLLSPTTALPQHFAPVRDHHQRFTQWLAQAGLDPLAACLAPALAHPAIRAVVVGCQSLEQFDEIHQAALRASQVGAETVAELAKTFALNDESFVNPAKWPK